MGLDFEKFCSAEEILICGSFHFEDSYARQKGKMIASRWKRLMFES
jgi:hypothetical protein